MKKPKTLQEKWLSTQIKLTKKEITECKKEIRLSRNPLITDPLNLRLSQLENDLKMQKIIYSQITNYKALK
jgi:hypothetical protein